MSASPSGNEPVLATDLHVQATYRLTEALVAAESRAARRVAMLSEIVFETDASRGLVFLNDAWARVLGYPVAQCLGKALSDFVLVEDREELERVFR
jgi:PAS domain-containing protein